MILFRFNYLQLTLLFLFGLFTSSFAQSMSGGQAGSTFSNDVSIGSIAWSNSSKAQASDNMFASASTLVGSNSTTATNYLAATGFNFSIPATATVTGIEVSLLKMEQGAGLGSSVTDNSIRIIKAGSFTGAEHASATAWPSAEATTNYGGVADTWGTTWTPAEINAANFGVGVSANLNAGLIALTLSAQVDEILITVYYDVPLPIELISFVAKPKEKEIELTWATATETNNHFFEVERSSDSKNFEKITQLKGMGNSLQTVHYTYTDKEPIPSTINYYRLKQVDFNGHYTYSQISTASLNKNEAAHSYPNPFSESAIVEINNEGGAEAVMQVFNSCGKLENTFTTYQSKIKIERNNLLNGTYFWKILINSEIISSGKFIITD